uniref:Immunoglobulin V-set domain-containing protein n=1 Tax=Amphiprion percula TaxID=161767 RepID=A0A3P8TYM4_AMPPE
MKVRQQMTKISVLKWSRPNGNSDGYVYFYRNNRCFNSYQHPRFHGRVQLRQPDMKDGDATLILRNVTELDAGIYECYTSVKNPGRSKRSSVETSQFINLMVTGESNEYSFLNIIVVSANANGNANASSSANINARLVVPAKVRLILSTKH